MNPDFDFTTSLFNIDSSSIESFATKCTEDTVVYEITLKRTLSSCPYCGGTLIGHGHKSKHINHPALRNRSGMILYHANRYICKSCKRTLFETNPFSLRGFNSSTLLLQDAMHLIGNLNYTLDMISKELHISPTQLNTYIDSFITIPPRPLPESLGIDELHSNALSRRTATYLCVLVDNENRCLYDILDSRSKYVLANHFSNIPRYERLRVKYITIDMWEPYRDIAKTYFPNAEVAVDPFHVIEHLTKDFESLRISLMKSCDYHSNGYYLLKKWNWLLTTANVDLDNERVFNHRFNMNMNRRDILNTIFDTFPKLHVAYELKEYYRRFNKEASYEDAVSKYDEIRKLFQKAEIEEYREFVLILMNWKDEILNSFQRPYDSRRLSNAYTENMNGKIRTYLDVSRGITNFTRFRKRVLYALNPKIGYGITARLRSEKQKGKSRGPYEKIRE